MWDKHLGAKTSKQLMWIRDVLCDKHNSVLFSSINSFNPQNRPTRKALVSFPVFLQMGKLRC